jgi:hypothetical protein
MYPVFTLRFNVAASKLPNSTSHICWKKKLNLKYNHSQGDNKAGVIKLSGEFVPLLFLEKNEGRLSRIKVIGPISIKEHGLVIKN